MPESNIVKRHKNRKERRRELMDMQKRISKMTPAEFESFFANIAYSYEVEYSNRTEAIYQKILHEQFGFGGKRLLRLQEAAQIMYDETRWKEI